jgi:hypothetical protein
MSSFQFVFDGDEVVEQRSNRRVHVVGVPLAVVANKILLR